jgi:hypothetical protein
MDISREFIEAEIIEVQSELQKAKTFVVQAETSLAIYRMLLAKLDTPDDVIENPGGTD